MTDSATVTGAIPWPDDPPPGQLPDKFRALLAEYRARRDAAVAANSEFINPDGSVLGLEDLYDEVQPTISASAREVDLACDSIGIREVYERLSKGIYGKASGDEQQISCPNPEHPDHNPSASMNENKQLFTCYKCYAKGTDKYAIAAYVWGLPVPVGKHLWEIKVQLAEELRGVVYRRPEPASPNDPQQPDPTWNAEDSDTREAQIEELKDKRLIQMEADYRARQQRSAGLFSAPLSINDLEAELAEPDPVIEWSVENLHSVGGNTTITAGFKVGKTTFVMNLVKALADNEPFLGDHDVRSLSGRIAYWNFEVEHVQMRRTFREMGIKNAATIWHLPLRGHSMNLMDDAAYAWALAEMRTREIEAWVLDPFSGAYYGDENDNSQITEFTKRIDEFKREAGIQDLYMPVHTGRFVEEGNERARGGAKLDDWTDNRWVIAKHPTTSDRFFKAEGRRVSQEERELLFHRDDNSLTYSTFGGTRKQKAGNVARGDILAFLTSHPGASGRQIVEAVGGKAETVRATVSKLKVDFEIETRSGPKNATLHYIYGTAPT